MKGKKGKILYVGGFELPDKNAAAHRVLSNAKAFRKLGYEVVLIGVSKEKVAAEILDTYVVYEGFDCYLTNYPNSYLNWFIYLTSIKKIVLSGVCNNVSAIICYNYPSIAQYKLSIFCKKNSIKLIADCTEWYTGSGFLFKKILKNIDTYIRMRILNFRVDGLIVISRYLESFYAKKIQGNLIPLPPLIDSSDKKWVIEENSNDKELQIIYAGSPGKGGKDRLDIVISSLYNYCLQNKESMIRLVIIGLNQQQLSAQFVINDKWFSLKNFKIDCRGRLSHKEVLSCLKKSDFHFFIRDVNRVTTAGFPTKFVESVSCQVPVLTNLSSNLEEYIEECGYIVNAEDEESLLQSLKYPLSLTAEERESFRNSINVELFDYNSYLKDIKDFLEKTL